MANNTGSEQHHFDIVIVGGGMVGVSMLRALANTRFRIAFVEAVSYHGDSQPSFDDRIIALSQSSRRIFENLALWQEIARHCCPIRHIHVSDKGRFGATRLHAADYGLDALGYVVTAKQLGAVLIKDLAQQRNLQIFQPAQVVGLEAHSDGYRLQVDIGKADADDASTVPSRRRKKTASATHKTPSDHGGDGHDSASASATMTLSCSLLIAADGVNSTLRELCKIPLTQHSYHQNAIVANVKCELDHQFTAYERFTREGPLALLPMQEKTMGIVWTHRKDSVQQGLALSDSEFCRQLQAAFGRRLGQLHSVGKRIQFPLQLSYPNSPVTRRMVLLGNAAHTLHPVAGQGFNLGMRDVAALAQLLEQAATESVDPGDHDLLRRYQQWRQPDHKTTIRFTHGLVTGFSNALAPISVARGLGLVLTDIITPLKSYLATNSMGLGVQTAQPKLMLQVEQ